MYKCIALRGSGTIWTGSAFDCLHTGNEIFFLSHSRTGAAICNNGAIVANVISVEERNYTSQLNVTVTSDIAGKTIECYQYDGLSITHTISLVIDTTGKSLCKLS